MPRKCRFCAAPIEITFVDLGLSPLSNAYSTQAQLSRGEMFFPLHAYVCESCFLVQLDEFEKPEAIFSDYAYFSSYSPSWLAHAKAYTELMLERFQLSRASHVVEIASNDGYLLQYFQAKGIPTLGIEPAANVAKVAKDAGIPTLVKFFGVNTAREMVKDGQQADLLLGNNVLAHVPDLNDFVAGMKILLKPSGIITMEFPHLLQLIRHNQFDTIYHEHFSYFSLGTVEKVFARHGLTVCDVEELSTHGGSLRIYARHSEHPDTAAGGGMLHVRDQEANAGLGRIETYTSFEAKVRETKRELLEFLIEARRAGKSIVGYGAPAKGNTLLNYCGVRTDFIDYTVDLNPHKQGRYLPGSRIPIYSPERIKETKPDYLLILPWNLRDEIKQQMAYIRDWGGRFVVPIPKTEVFA